MTPSWLKLSLWVLLTASSLLVFSVEIHPVGNGESDALMSIYGAGLVILTAVLLID